MKWYKLHELKEVLKSFLKDPFFLHHWERDWYGRPLEEGSDQLSVRFQGVYGGFYRPGTDSWMFIEDLHLSSAPFAGMSVARTKYSADLVPNDQKKVRMVSEALSERAYHTLTSSLFSFIRDTAQELFQSGVVYYEMIKINDDSGQLTGLDFQLIQPRYLFKFLNSYYQLVPWWVARKSHLKVQIIKIPGYKVLRIDFPKELGGRRRLGRILDRMSRISKPFIPEFTLKAMQENRNIGFDLDKFKEARYLEIASLTKKFGWNQRQLRDGYITEHYSMVRALRTKKALWIIRNLIISKLNDVLSGQYLDLKTSVKVEGLFELADVEAHEKRLAEGDISFSETMQSLND